MVDRVINSSPFNLRRLIRRASFSEFDRARLSALDVQIREIRILVCRLDETAPIGQGETRTSL